MIWLAIFSYALSYTIRNKTFLCHSITWINNIVLIYCLKSFNETFFPLANKTQMVNQNGKSVVVRIPTEPQSEPNEASPLNQRGRDNNSDASSASAVTSEQSTKKLIDADMDHSRRRLLRVCIDFLLFCSGEFLKKNC